MQPIKIKSYKSGPEAKIQKAIKDFLFMKQWHVMETHGNMYQSGFPDLWATNVKYGQRWVEVKLPNMKGSKFTPAQLEHFPKICANGSGVWIITAATEEEYLKLFKPSNYWTYLSVWRT